jgi:hypothetical protein
MLMILGWLTAMACFRWRWMRSTVTGYCRLCLKISLRL